MPCELLHNKTQQNNQLPTTPPTQTTTKNLRWDGLNIVLVLGTLAHTLVSFIRRRKISVNKSQNTVCLTFAVMIAYVLKPGNPECLQSALSAIYLLSLVQMIALTCNVLCIFKLFCFSDLGLGNWLVLIVRFFQIKSCGEPNSSKLSDQEIRIQSLVWPQVTGVTVAD